jgi:hypothetical protein
VSSVIWYHGTKGDNIVSIVKSGSMRPRDGKIYFSSVSFGGCFAMGADTKRKACFVIKVAFELPGGCSIENKVTNVPGTKILHTTSPLNVRVLEMYVRQKPGSTPLIFKTKVEILSFLEK